MDTVKIACLEEIKSFDDLKIGDSLFLSVNGEESKEYKITKIELYKRIETKPPLPIEIRYEGKNYINFAFTYTQPTFSNNRKLNNKPFYSRFSKHYSHK